MNLMGLMKIDYIAISVSETVHTFVESLVTAHSCVVGCDLIVAV